jgi:hypothetical protein
MGTNLCPVKSYNDAISNQKFVEDFSVPVVLNLSRCRVTLSAAFIPQLQLWPLHQLASVQTLGGPVSQVP